jgi:hypothetical protein
MAEPAKQLGVFDATLLVMGGVVGGGVFVTPSVVASIAHRPALIVGAWLAGGAIAITGALVLSCWGVVTATVVHDPRHALLGIAALGSGLPVYALWRRVPVAPA